MLPVLRFYTAWAGCGRSAVTATDPKGMYNDLRLMEANLTMRELLTTLKMLLITAPVAIIYGTAYGSDIGARAMGIFCLLIVVVQCWTHRSDILRVMQRDR